MASSCPIGGIALFGSCCLTLHTRSTSSWNDGIDGDGLRPRREIMHASPRPEGCNNIARGNLLGLITGKDRWDTALIQKYGVPSRYPNRRWVMEGLSSEGEDSI